MKHTIVRAEPALPPIEKIVLEFTPGEFLTLFRRFESDWHRDVTAVAQPRADERIHGFVPQFVKREMESAARAVGILE